MIRIIERPIWIKVVLSIVADPGLRLSGSGSESRKQMVQHSRGNALLIEPPPPQKKKKKNEGLKTNIWLIPIMKHKQIFSNFLFG